MSGMGLTQINSLLTSANTMKHVDDMRKNRVILQRQMLYLSDDIEIAKKAGADTEKLEKRYSEMEESMKSIEEDVVSTAKELTERIASDNKKISEEKAEQTRKEDEDTVEISPEARALAEAHTERAEDEPLPYTQSTTDEITKESVPAHADETFNRLF